MTHCCTIDLRNNIIAKFIKDLPFNLGKSEKLARLLAVVYYIECIGDAFSFHHG